MENKTYQPSPLLTTNTTPTRSVGTATNTTPRNNSSPNLRKMNKHSNNISKPITKNVSNNNNPKPIPKNHSFDYKHMLTQVETPLPPSVYRVTKSEFKDFVQKVTSCTPNITAPPPPINKPKPTSTRLQSIRPPPLMPINNRQSLPLDTAAVSPGNPINLVNNMNPINNVNDAVVAPQPLSPLPPFPTVDVGVESPITSYLRFVNESMMSSSFPMLSPGILFSPRVD
ncbi:hypothetical protein Lal_00030877 [Lupinus albus]|uniref:Uncharacterized protein n=1 Tax=Lupinus albus TaxID=3870 RepID=A0A6A5LVE0_LUPAL|nr:hypothetical protein Lalb_Chr17g0344261 [Lupinus albus]KAF1863773.1 hypothetical protein Lal_00030877 [Lupinus albus]